MSDLAPAGELHHRAFALIRMEPMASAAIDGLAASPACDGLLDDEGCVAQLESLGISGLELGRLWLEVGRSGHALRAVLTAVGGALGAFEVRQVAQGIWRERGLAERALAALSRDGASGGIA